MARKTRCGRGRNSAGWEEWGRGQDNSQWSISRVGRLRPRGCDSRPAWPGPADAALGPPALPHSGHRAYWPSPLLFRAVLGGQQRPRTRTAWGSIQDAASVLIVMAQRAAFGRKGIFTAYFQDAVSVYILQTEADGFSKPWLSLETIFLLL